MPGIRILSEQLANKIAAGEVVQRPSSVVKELMENAIDAGATEILVSIENGGKDQIRVVDNGTGMNGDDLLLAFEQYATSKIVRLEDLEDIHTLGFRGEALPSIASVSMVEARSCLPGEHEGNRLTIHGGEIQQAEPVPMKPGTHVSVRRLFYNTPARRKFLRTPNAEYRHIIDTVRRFALGYPQLRIQLFSNGNEVFILEPSDLGKRITDVFSGHYRQKLIPVKAADGPYSLKGFVGGLDLVRKKGGEQYLFINDRLVNDRRMNAAVYNAFVPMIEKGEYPFFVLKLYLPAEEVDVNVHPQKTEIKLRNEWQIYHFIRGSISGVLRETLSVINTMDDRPPEAREKVPEYRFSRGGRPGQQEIQPDPGRTSRLPAPEPLPEHHPLSRRIEKFHQNMDLNRSVLPGRDSTVSLWQAHNKYIFVQIASAVIIIDQHAAHERILFEKAMKTFSGAASRASQQLLFPVSLELSPDDFSLLAEVMDAFSLLGFSLRAFGKNTMLIEAVPADLRSIDEGRIVLEILDYYRECHETRQDKRYNMAASYACKAAIKTGDKLEPAEMQNLVDQLFQTESPYACPHGRPTIINLTLEELDRRFKRT